MSIVHMHQISVFFTCRKWVCIIYILFTWNEWMCIVHVELIFIFTGISHKLFGSKRKLGKTVSQKHLSCHNIINDQSQHTQIYELIVSNVYTGINSPHTIIIWCSHVKDFIWDFPYVVGMNDRICAGSSLMSLCSNWVSHKIDNAYILMLNTIYFDCWAQNITTCVSKNVVIEKNIWYLFTWEMFPGLKLNIYTFRLSYFNLYILYPVCNIYIPFVELYPLQCPAPRIDRNCSRIALFLSLLLPPTL